MQWPVKARGCQHLSFLNHDIGNQILAVYPERGGGGLAASGSQYVGTFSALHWSRQAIERRDRGGGTVEEPPAALCCSAPTFPD